MGRTATNDTGKQAILPLWGSPSSARTVNMIALGRFRDLCDALVDADDAHDEARMDAVLHDLRAIVAHIGQFKRARFQKWAREREGQRS